MRSIVAQAGRLAFWLVICFAVLVGIAAVLPHDRYLRFSNLHTAAVVKYGWIYERIHFDPTPIDVAFIGTSRFAAGVDSEAIDRTYAAANGRPLNSVNFAVQHWGRNVHFLIARELLQTRTPRLLVVEIPDDEPRDLHPTFYALAEPADIIGAPLLINISYLSDLLRLPQRQLTLFAQTLAPGWFGVRPRFDPARYRGSHWDDTYQESGSFDHPIRNPVPRTKQNTAEELRRQWQRNLQEQRAKLALPPAFHDLERRANLAYLDDLLALAEAKHVPVRFLYMPPFESTAAPRYQQRYAAHGPIWTPPTAVRDPAGNWQDVFHFNATGAEALSRWLAGQLAETEIACQQRRPAGGPCGS